RVSARGRARAPSLPVWRAARAGRAICGAGSLYHLCVRPAAVRCFRPRRHAADQPSLEEGNAQHAGGRRALQKRARRGARRGEDGGRGRRLRRGPGGPPAAAPGRPRAHHLRGHPARAEVPGLRAERRSPEPQEGVRAGGRRRGGRAPRAGARRRWPRRR
ncbi:unnamed protein product, partial [Prorocentrum cordatum]